jgi:hypothetical protein
MTDTGSPRTRTRSATTQRPAAPSPTAWAGWVVFAACVMFLVATFQVVEGLVAIFDKGYYQVTSNGLVVHVSYTSWGWVHLILGVVIAFSAGGVLVGNLAARTVGVILAAASAVVNLLFLPAYPVWGMIIIAVDILVIYALIVHGREMRDPSV